MGTSEEMAAESGSPTRYQLADDLDRQLVRLARLSAVFEAKRAAQDDALERAPFILLVELVRHGPQRSVDLAESVHTDPSTVSRQIAMLVEVGMVERRSDPVDGRANLLAATTSGKQAFELVRERRNSSITRVIRSWDPRDGQRLLQLLQRFNSDAEAEDLWRWQERTDGAVRNGSDSAFSEDPDK